MHKSASLNHYNRGRTFQELEYLYHNPDPPSPLGSINNCEEGHTETLRHARSGSAVMRTVFIRQAYAETKALWTSGFAHSNPELWHPDLLRKICPRKSIPLENATSIISQQQWNLRHWRRRVRPRTRELLAKDVGIDVDAMKAEENLCIVARNLLIPSWTMGRRSYYLPSPLCWRPLTLHVTGGIFSKRSVNPVNGPKTVDRQKLNIMKMIR